MNIPNILTLIRIILIAPFVYSYLYLPVNGDKIALIILLLSGITDLLDGFIARKFNKITKIGIVLDPLADKMLLIAVLAVFVIDKRISFWVLLLMFCKELLMVLAAFSLYNEKGEVIPANFLGKISTIMFYMSSIAIIMGSSMGYFLILLFLFFNIISLFFYSIKYLSKLKCPPSI